MGKYVLLLNWTDQGIRNVKDTVKRAESLKSYIEKKGGKLVDILYTFGQYDAIVIAELPKMKSLCQFHWAQVHWAMFGLQLLRQLVWMKREK
jgi:uncharacterized protein with GYD domain